MIRAQVEIAQWQKEHGIELPPPKAYKLWTWLQETCLETIQGRGAGKIRHT
jgi:hypothetical protein